MAKITYNDKVALIVNPDIADENKVTDNDMNEIKQVVNENAINISNEVDEDYRVNFLKGKNLINCNGFTSYSTTGVNVTTNKTDGLLDYINVTKSSSTSENIFISICNFTLSKETGTYNLSGCPSGGGESTYQLYFRDGTTTQDVFPRNDGTPASVSLTKGHNYTLYLRLNASATFTDKKFYPMLLPTTETDTSYEPYITPSIYVDNEEIYSKDNLGLVKTKQLGITYSSSGTNIILTIPVNLLDTGTILISGRLTGIDDVILNFIISYASRYSYELISKRGTNIGNNNITTSYSNNAIVMTIPFVATNMPTGIGTVKASMIYLG